MNRPLTVLALSILLAPLHAARADGDFGAARDRTDRFKTEYEALRRLTPEETRRLVTAMLSPLSRDRRRHERDALDLRLVANGLPMTSFALRIDHRAWLDKPDMATAIAEALDHPAFRELRRVAYNKGSRNTRHQPRTAASVKEILLSKDCDGVHVDSGRTGKETAFGMIFTGRHILNWDADKRVITSYVVVPYDAASPPAIAEGFSLLAAALDSFGGYLCVEPTHVRARHAVFCGAPLRHEVRDYPRRARERKAHFRYAERQETQIAGPEWGLFLGPGHLARVTPDPAVFPIIRDDGRGKLCLLSDNPEDALGEAFDARLEAARRALAPILMDVSEVPVDE